MAPTDPTATAPAGRAAPAPTVPARLWRSYARAVRDAAVAEPHEIRRDLVAITPDNPALVWKDGRVLVATWTGWDGYVGKQGQEMDLGVPVWVTVAYQARDRCRQANPKRLDLRIAQLLGLPPDAGPGNRFVEMWASPDDIFRPCADPAITDSTCGLLVPKDPAPPPAILAFLGNQAIGSYHLADREPPPPGVRNGYPWTRLGYTYDWNRRSTPVGLSEFVVNQGAKVKIETVEETAVYCRPPASSAATVVPAATANP